MAETTITKEMLSKLISNAMEPNDEIAVRDLLDALDKIDPEVLKGAAEEFDKLCEAWEEGVTQSEDKANICVRLAELSVLSTPACRASLHAAVRKLLPPYLASGSVIKAIGAKDENVSVHDAALRLRKLQHLRSTAIVYQSETHQWGKIHGIDNVTGTIAIASLAGGSVSSVPIANAIFSLHFFNTTPEMMNLLYPGKTNCRPSAEYRKIFKMNSLSEIYDQRIHDILQRLMIPAIMTQEAFETWWLAETIAAAKTAVRPFWEARSVLELYTLLKPIMEKGDVQISEEAALRLQKLFEHLHREMQAKDISMLTECIAALASANTPEILKAMYLPLRGKAAFWPAEVSPNMPLAALEQWGRLAMKPLTGFVKATSLLYTPEEMAQMGALLPLKCISVVFATLPQDIVQSTILAQKMPSCDLILWIFKNKTSLPSRISSEIDMAHCIAALSIEGLPKEWSAAQRELRKSVFDKADFQKYVIENADGDIPSIIGALQRYRKFQPGERQSIMVKLSRQSKEVQEYLESGAGSKMMGASGEKTVKEEPPVTSIASQKRLADELQDLITRQIPANAAAVALARSYGDLRENAEYDAAKADRRRLHGRRSELERILGFLQPTDFKNIEIKGHAVIGSIVTLSADGNDQDYYLLGAYDGNPDKRYVSYQAGIGKALLHKQIGETVELPGSGKFTIKDVRPLPEDLRKELANEA